MAKSYQQIKKQIEQLQRQADALRDSEIKGVVDRIKVAIAHYGLTAAHLGLGAASASPKAASKRSAKASAQFSDDAGNKWSGRGPRPRWLRDALAAGRSIEEFRAGSNAKSKLASAIDSLEAAKPAAKAKKAKRAPSKVNYSDDAGNSWTGRGPKPRWLKAALDSGKTLQEFAK